MNEKLEALMNAEEEMFYRMCQETDATKKAEYREKDKELKAEIRKMAEELNII